MKTDNNSDKNVEVLRAAGRLFAERGYGRIEAREIAEYAGVEESFIHSEYSDKAGLCHAWLLNLHRDAEERHRELLDSDLPAIDKVARYFDYLSEWMEENDYAGCPFTRIVNSLGIGESPEIRNEVRQHKEFVADFFIILARHITGETTVSQNLGEKLFFLYSAAMTESKNLHSLWPVQRAKKMALDACLEVSKTNYPSGRGGE